MSYKNKVFNSFIHTDTIQMVNYSNYQFAPPNILFQELQSTLGHQDSYTNHGLRTKQN